MSWVKIDDQFADHPKIKQVGAIGLAIQVAALCYCAKYLTDGFLSFSVADSLIRSVLSPITESDGMIITIEVSSNMWGQNAEEYNWKKLMVEAGLWEISDGKDGFILHDYLEYNPSRDSVLRKREEDKKRKAQ